MKEEKKVQRIAAGNVILIQYTGGNKPCDRCMCVNLAPLTIEDGHISNFHTAFAVDLDTEQFIREGPINNVEANVSKVTSLRLKNWYYKQVVALCQARKKNNHIR